MGVVEAAVFVVVDAGCYHTTGATRPKRHLRPVRGCAQHTRAAVRHAAPPRVLPAQPQITRARLCLLEQLPRRHRRLILYYLGSAASPLLLGRTLPRIVRLLLRGAAGDGGVGLTCSAACWQAGRERCRPAAGVGEV